MGVQVVSSSTAQYSSHTHDILPKKRLCSELYAPYAQYGLGHGSIPKRSTIYSCVVITTGWSSWVLAALAHGVQVVLVICKDPSWRDLIIKHISPSSEIMFRSDITSALSGAPTVDFCFSDEDFSQGKLKSLWLYVQHCIVVARPARQPPVNWYCTPICEDNLDPQLDQGNEEVIRVAVLTFI